MLNKLFRFIAIGFPGGYRFVAIFAISYFYLGSIVESYSKGFFWVILIVSVSGIPISSVMSNRLKCVPPIQIYSMAIVAVSVFTAVGYLAFFSQEGYVFLMNVFGASLALSFYEVTKKRYFNEELYNSIFWCSCASLVCFFFVLVVSISYPEISEYLLLLVFFVLYLPVVGLELISSLEDKNLDEITGGEFIKSYWDYLLSNIFSVSLNSIIPLLLIYWMGSDAAPELAQVFSISTVLLLFPRFIAIQNIGKLRRVGPSYALIYGFYDSMKWYLIIVGIISLAAFSQLYDQNWLILWGLLFGIQLSQVYLPFSTVLAVEGKSRQLMFINFKGSIVFVAAACLCYLIFPDLIVQLFMVSFCFHHAIKLYLTKIEAQVLIKIPEVSSS